MKTISLTKGHVALVSDEDFFLLSQFKWCAIDHKNHSLIYAGRSGRKELNEPRTVLMHRQILGMDRADKRKVDHADGNGLNCQRDNIRACTHPQNLRNRTVTRTNPSGYKGVFCRGDKFRVGIRNTEGKLISLGTYPNAKAAARVYDAAALALHGEFAKLNFPIGASLSQ